MLTVACVLWCGKFQGANYKPEHVLRLREMVAGHLSSPHQFRCLSNIECLGAERIPLKNDWPGWWSKIEVFRPGLFEGRVLYLDLDVTVVGSLDELADHDASFIAIKDWQRPTLNSSVMSWEAGYADHLYREFSPDLIDTIKGGDQTWITQNLPPDVQTFPPNLCPSFKHQCRYSVPKDARVVVFHGLPRPWDLKKELVFA